jgi:hypothetical protein
MERARSPVDFVGIFNQRLKEMRQSFDGSPIKEIDEGILKRRAPVIVMTIKDGVGHRSGIPGGIWIEAREGLPIGRHPHSVVGGRFSEYISKHGLEGDIYSAGQLIESADDKRYLVLDGDGSIDAIESKNSSQEYFLDTWKDLMNDYKIEALIVDWLTMAGFGYGDDARVITSDMMWRYRAGDVVNEIAQEYQMTNSEFLRFWTLTVDDKERKQQGSWEEIAKEIVTPKWAARV